MRIQDIDDDSVMELITEIDTDILINEIASRIPQRGPAKWTVCLSSLDLDDMVIHHVIGNTPKEAYVSALQSLHEEMGDEDPFDYETWKGYHPVLGVFPGHITSHEVKDY